MRFTPTIQRLLLTAGLLSAAAAPLRAEVTPMTPITASDTMSTLLAAELPEASGIEWMEQQDGLHLLASNSFSNDYLTPHGFSKNLVNDSLAARLQVKHVDPELPSRESYDMSRQQLRTDDELNLTAVWIAGLGLLTASVSGILLYARNPIPRKRKYRRSAEERHQQVTA
jgi:hypothetical protein